MPNASRACSAAATPQFNISSTLANQDDYGVPQGLQPYPDCPSTCVDLWVIDFVEIPANQSCICDPPTLESVGLGRPARRPPAVHPRRHAPAGLGVWGVRGARVEVSMQGGGGPHAVRRVLPCSIVNHKPSQLPLHPADIHAHTHMHAHTRMHSVPSWVPASAANVQNPAADPAADLGPWILEFRQALGELNTAYDALTGNLVGVLLM